VNVTEVDVNHFTRRHYRLSKLPTRLLAVSSANHERLMQAVSPGCYSSTYQVSVEVCISSHSLHVTRRDQTVTDDDWWHCSVLMV